MAGYQMDMQSELQSDLASNGSPQVDNLINTLIDALSANVAILAPDTTICAVNAAWRTFADENGCRSSAHCLGMNYLEVCRQAEVHCSEARMTAAALESVASGQVASASIAYTLDLADGPHYFKQTISRFTSPCQDWLAVCHEDVTAVVRLENERRSHASEIMSAQDSERRSIARELHDSTAQHLSAIALLSQAVRQRGLSDDIVPLMSELDEILREAQREIRNLSYLLHPPLLSEIGLEASLKQYIDGFSRRTGIEVAFEWKLAPAHVERTLEGAILRLVQEALANVYRHSGADSALVSIEAECGETRVTVADSGAGLPAEIRREGVGMQSMRSRVAQFGGTLSIRHNSGGTCVEATFPAPCEVKSAHS